MGCCCRFCCWSLWVGRALRSLAICRVLKDIKDSFCCVTARTRTPIHGHTHQLRRQTNVPVHQRHGCRPSICDPVVLVTSLLVVVVSSWEISLSVVRGKKKLSPGSPGSKRAVGILGVTLCPPSHTAYILPIPFVRYYTVGAAGTISPSSGSCFGCDSISLTRRECRDYVYDFWFVPP